MTGVLLTTMADDVMQPLSFENGSGWLNCANYQMNDASVNDNSSEKLTNGVLNQMVAVSCKDDSSEEQRNSVLNRLIALACKDDNSEDLTNIS